MSSKPGKGKGKNKRNKPNNREPEELEDSHTSEPQKQETPSLPADHQHTGNAQPAEKQETPTAQDEITNTDASRNQDSSLDAQASPSETSHPLLEAAQQSKESETAQTLPKTEEAVVVSPQSQPAESQQEQEQPEPARAHQEPPEQAENNVEPVQTSHSHTEEVKVEEPQPEPEPDHTAHRDTAEFEIISSGDFTKISHLPEEAEDAQNRLDGAAEPQEVPLEEPLQQEQAIAEPPHAQHTTELLVDQKQAPAELEQPTEHAQHTQVRAESEAFHSVVPQQQESHISEPVEAHHHAEEQQQEHPAPVEEKQEPQDAHQSNQESSRPDPQPDYTHRFTESHSFTESERQESKAEDNNQTSELIDLNKPIDEDSPRKNTGGERLFRLVESNEISVNASNEISEEGSVEAKRECHGVPVKSSISFSDLNYSIEVSASQERELAAVQHQADRVDEHPAVQNDPIREVEPAQPIFVSQQVEVLSESLPQDNAEVFYSIVNQSEVQAVPPEAPVEALPECAPEIAADAIEHHPPQPAEAIEPVQAVADEPILDEPAEVQLENPVEPQPSDPVVLDASQPVLLGAAEPAHEPAPEPLHQAHQVLLADPPHHPAAEQPHQPAAAEPQHHVEPVHLPAQPALPVEPAADPAAEPAAEPVQEVHPLQEPAPPVVAEPEVELEVRLEPVEEKRQVDPVEPQSSVFRKLVISTAVGGIAAGALYLSNSSKAGSVALGLASLALTFLAV